MKLNPYPFTQVQGLDQKTIMSYLGPFPVCKFD